MTRDADFKRIVRERMSRTGEPYELARARLRASVAHDLPGNDAQLTNREGGYEPRHGPREPFERFDESAKRVLTLAQEEAELAGDDHLGPEHLLLALLRGPDVVARRTLEDLGIELGRIREEVDRVLGRSSRGSPRRPRMSPSATPTPHMKRVIELAFAEAERQVVPQVDTEHLLLGLLLEGDGVVTQILRDAGATFEKVWARLACAVPRLGSLEPLAVAPRSLRPGMVATMSSIPLIEMPGTPLLSVSPNLIDASTMRNLVSPRLGAGGQGPGRAVWQLVPAQIMIAASHASDREWEACLPSEREPLTGLGDAAFIVSGGHVLVVRSSSLVLQVRAVGVDDSRRALVGLARYVLDQLLRDGAVDA